MPRMFFLSHFLMSLIEKVDEGHSMGGSRYSSSIQFASWIWTERRWAMTGTPTKQTATQLNQFHALMTFLRHEFFTSRSEGDKTWRESIARPWREGCLVSFFRLRSLLELLMKRHTKLDIAELEPPLLKTTLVPLSFMESTAYNTLVCGVKSNILITSMKGKTSGAQDSLLHRSQSKHAREALRNIQGVCIGWSRVVPTLQIDHFYETLDHLEEHGVSKETIESIRRYLIGAQEERLTPCAFCDIQLSTLLMLPCCGCLVCPECMDGHSPTCLVCDQEFDVDGFQRLQPGFVLEWKSNLEADRNKRGRMLHIPEIGSEESSASSGHFNAPAHIQAIPAPDPPRSRTAKFGDGHQCIYDRQTGDGRCTQCLVEHSPCNLMNPESRCHTCYRKSLECPEEESKASYLTNRLLDLYNERRRFVTFPLSNGSFGTRGKDTRPFKAIIFSQFRKALNFVGDRLLQRFGTACVAEYWGRYRTSELHKFTHDNECFCMLLSKDGSEGLDLSFVTHIFFLEKIWEKSLADQAVARAWRMGACGRVEVETLIAQHSLEEEMLEIDTADKLSRKDQYQDSDASDVSANGSGKMNENDLQRAKTHYLLKSLNFITDYHQFCADSKIARHPDIDAVEHLHEKIDPKPVLSSPSFSPRQSRKRVLLDIAIPTSDSSVSNPTKRARFNL